MTVSPVLPETLLFSGRQYILPFQQIGFDRKADQHLQCDTSAFGDWIQWGDSDGNILYSADQSDTINFKLEPIGPAIETLELSGEVDIAQLPAAMRGGPDDSCIAIQDSMIDGLLFTAPQEIPSQQNSTIYTNQPSWSQTQPLDIRTHQSKNRYPQLSTEQDSKITRFALPHSATTKSSKSPQLPRSRRKRKTSTFFTSSSLNSVSPHLLAHRHSAPKREAHNMVEKRYRSNLNEKIEALRDSVPSLRIFEKSSNGSASIGEDSQELGAAYKLNKV